MIQDAESLADDPTTSFLWYLMEEDRGRNEVEVTVREFGLLGGGLPEVDAEPTLSRSFACESQHGFRRVDAPNRCF